GRTMLVAVLVNVVASACCLMTSNIVLAITAPSVSSVLLLLCWMATGNIAATMMKPMPRIITAKRTSVKFMPRWRRRWESLGPGAGDDGARQDGRLDGFMSVALRES